MLIYYRLMLCVSVGVVVNGSPEQSDLELTYPGDLYIGALFPVHHKEPRTGGCSSELAIDGFFALEAFLFSLDELNVMLNSTVGFTLGALAYDTCSSEKYALVKALKFVINDYLRDNMDNKTQNSKRVVDVIGVVGPMKSSVTIQVANLLGLFKIPQISYAATSSSLSNKELYPYFMRTVPSDMNQAKALMEILKFMNITYVVGVYGDSNYGTRGFREFEMLAERTDVCFAYKWKIDTEAVLTSDYFREHVRLIYRKYFQARAVVLYVHQELAAEIFRAVSEEKLNDHFIWIGSDGWGNRYFPQVTSMAIEGAIVSLPVYKTLPKFSDYFYSLNPNNVADARNPWFKEFWQKAFKCNSTTSKNVTSEECAGIIGGNLTGRVKGTEFGSLHFVRDAVYAYGNALIEMHREFCNNTGKGVCKSMMNELRASDGRQLLERLKNGSFSGVEKRTIRFLNGQDGLPEYTIANYQRQIDGSYTWKPIATFIYDNDHSSRWIKTDVEPKFKTVSPNFPRSFCGSPCAEGRVRRYKQDKCCWSCEACPFPLYQHNETHCNFCITSSTNSPPFYKPNDRGSGCETLTPVYVHFDNTFVLGVTALTLVGLILAISTCVLFVHYSNTPIIKASSRELSVVLLLGITICYGTVFVVVLKPGSYTCTFARFLYSLGYTVSYAAIFVKTNRIARIFRRKGSHGPSPKRPKYVSPLSQLFIVLVLVGFQSLLNVVWLVLKPSTPAYQTELNYEERTVVVHLFCEAFKDEDMIIALIFPVCLLILSAVYAFKTRKIPGRFNETKFIIITTYTTCIVWLAFVPVFFSTEKIPLRIYSLCAALVLNATVTLICMFLPKLYVAVCRPHKNTRDNVMGRRSVVSLSSWGKRTDDNNGCRLSVTQADVTESDVSSRDRQRPKYFEMEPSIYLYSDRNENGHSVKTSIIRRSF